MHSIDRAEKELRAYGKPDLARSVAHPWRPQAKGREAEAIALPALRGGASLWEAKLSRQPCNSEHTLALV